MTLVSRIVVTGAAGFIGSHLTERLLSDGHEVVCLDNFCDFYDPSIKRDNLKVALKSERFRLLEGDIRDAAALDSAFAGCDAVVHLAAMAGIRPSMERPVLYQDVNVGGTLSVLDKCRRHNIKNLIFASSSSVYGNNHKVPFSESDPVDQPISVYAATKKAGELLCHTYHYAYGIDVTCLRFFTVYGPRQRPDLAIHKFCRRILEGVEIEFFGDGSMERDFTYIKDIVDGIIAAIATNVGHGYRIINLGNDRPIRLDKLVSLLESVLKKKAIIKNCPVPIGDVSCTWADLTLAKTELGYRPKVSFEYGLGEFVSWLTQGLGDSSLAHL